MFRLFLVIMLFLSSPALRAQGADSAQSWTASDGKTIQAKFVRIDGEAVVIENNGKSFTVPFAKLSPESVDLAKRLGGNAAGEAATPTDTATKRDAATIAEKLNRIIIPRIDFDNTPVKEAIDFLSQRAVELDTLEADATRKGVKFGFNKSTAPDKIDALRVNGLHISNVPLKVALKYVCDSTKLHYMIEDSQVTLIPRAEYVTEIQTRTFTVPPDFLVRLAAGYGGGAENNTRNPLLQYLRACGVEFAEGASATLSGNQLQVTNTRMSLDAIEQLVGTLAAQAASDPTLQFRWLQTDPKTTDAIVDVIKANTLSADAFSAKIDPQIKSGKITEIAAFDRKIISGERFVLTPKDKIVLAMEVEANLSQDMRLVDLRCVPEWTPETQMGSGLLRVNTATTISRQHWHLLALWGDGKTDTLLLARGGSDPAKPAVKQDKSLFGAPPVVVHLDAEWRESTAADLAKVTQAPPESRAKALVWLRERSTLLAGANVSGKSGQKSTHEHLWGGKSDAQLEAELNRKPDKDPKEPAPRPGVIFGWEPLIKGSDKPLPIFPPTTPVEENVAKADESILSQELDLKLNATYVPIKARSKSQGMDFQFQGMMRPGVPEFVTANAAPQQGQPVVILVLTSWVEIIR